MTSSKILAVALGAAVIIAASGAEARVIRSGGSTDVSNHCDAHNPNYGPFIGLFRDSDGAQVDLYNEGGSDQPLRVLIDDCIGSFYEFDADEDLQFEGSLDGDLYLLMQNENVASTLAYTFGAHQVTSNSFTGGPFPMPAELQTITAEVSFNLIATLTIVAKAGYSLFACGPIDFGSNVCVKQGDALGDLSFASDSAFMRVLPVSSEVPLPGALVFMLTGIGGLAAARRKKALRA